MKILLYSVPAFLLANHLLGQVPVSQRDVTHSENGRYSVEISAARLDQPLVTVFNHAEGQPAQVWSRSLQEAEAAEMRTRGQTFFPAEWRSSVSNDGKTVVLRPRYARGDSAMLRVLTQAGGDKQFLFDELTALLENPDASEDPFSWADETRFLEMFLEQEQPPILALWSPATAQWAGLNLEKLELFKADAELSKRLNALALPMARETIRRHRPSGLKKLLQRAIDTAGEWVPGVLPMTSASSFNQNANLESAYFFIARQKQPADRALIEELLDAEFYPFFDGGIWMRGSELPTVGLRSAERALADQLLAEWDGRPALEDDEELSISVGMSEKLHRLGSVSGRVYLPFETPENSKAVWIYLMPARLSGDAWQNHDSVLATYYEINPRFAPSQEIAPISVLNFFFDTVPPGEYRVKAVWDRRLPFVEVATEKAMCIPSPGDYESAQSAPFTLAAGQRVEELRLDCTNRVGQASEYFAADEIWSKKHPARPIPTQSAWTPGARVKEKVLARRPVKEWVLQTNENRGKIAVRRIEVREYGPPPLTGKRMVVRVVIPGLPANGNAMLGAQLVDEHGCVFETRGHSSRGRVYDLSFPNAPYGAEKIELRISREDFLDARDHPFQDGPRETLLGSFTLANLTGVKPEEWKPDPIPAKKELDIVTVELVSFEPGAVENSMYGEFSGGAAFYGGGAVMMHPQGRPPEHKFSFSANGQPARGWRKLRGAFQDRWGNSGNSPSNFCVKEDVLRYIVHFARDPEAGAFLPEEKLEVRVEKIPGAGENVELGLHKELQGMMVDVYSISGLGEFTYKDGELIAAKAEAADDANAFVPQFGARGRVVESKLRLKPVRGRPMPMGPMGPRVGREVTLISKIPHVACRVPDLGPDTLFALIEQDTSVAEPMNSPQGPGVPRYFPGRQASEIQFLPVDYRAGDTDRKLTFVVQKARKAEFLVRVPRDERSPR